VEKIELSYPISAIVGQEAMVEALLLLAVDPSIGGLLLVGEKGTAKSTAARALANLLPPIKVYHCPYHCQVQGLYLCDSCRISPPASTIIAPPFRTIPLGVTEERLLGGLDLDRTLAEGTPIFKPGLLGEANGGLIYIDEVNLLDPSLAHLMLDAVSLGRVILEREGFSFSYPARVALLGSMNPEEGPIGPQLLDRFSMSVTLKGEMDPGLRAEIVKRRLEFENDPISFNRLYRDREEELFEAISNAKERLKDFTLTEEAQKRAAELSIKAFAAGHRADIALARAARALASLKEKNPAEVGPQWVDRVEHLVIPSRLRAEKKKGKNLIKAEYTKDSPKEKGTTFEPIYLASGEEIPPQWRPENLSEEDKMLFTVFQVGEAYSIPAPKVQREMGAKDKKGKRSFRETLKARGRAFRTTARRLGRPVSLSATLRAAAPHQKERAHKQSDEDLASGNKKRILLSPADFREKVYRLKTGRLVIFVVDSSGSIGTLYRMEEAKAAALSLLTDAYQKRDRVAIVAFYGAAAELLLPPTNSPDLAGRLLSNLPSGGKTPLSHALALTEKLVRTERAKDPMLSPYIILMTDGRPNIPLDPQKEPWKEVLGFADLLAQDPSLNFLLIDTDRGFFNEFKLTRELSLRLNAPRLTLEELKNGQLEKWLSP
jgi:magnesium chelatase subunit D